MRIRVLLSAAVAAAAFVAIFVPMTSASADGDTVITIGPSQYTVGTSHPTGSVSVGGGTISARCTAAALKGSAALHTPQCVTRKIACPMTSAGCSMVVNVRESALRGPVEVGGNLFLYSGSFTFVGAIQPYNCPQLYSCGARLLYTITPGTIVQLGVFNDVFAPNYPTVFGQLTLTVS